MIKEGKGNQSLFWFSFYLGRGSGIKFSETMYKLGPYIFGITANKY